MTNSRLRLFPLEVQFLLGRLGFSFVPKEGFTILLHTFTQKTNKTSIMGSSTNNLCIGMAAVYSFFGITLAISPKVRKNDVYLFAPLSKSFAPHIARAVFLGT